MKLSQNLMSVFLASAMTFAGCSNSSLTPEECRDIDDGGVNFVKDTLQNFNRDVGGKYEILLNPDGKYEPVIPSTPPSNLDRRLSSIYNTLGKATALAYVKNKLETECDLERTYTATRAFIAIYKAYETLADPDKKDPIPPHPDTSLRQGFLLT